MRVVPGHYPRNAIRRLVRQSAPSRTLYTRQQAVTIQVLNYANLAGYLATPGNLAYGTIQDANQILPYTTFRINLDIDAPTAPQTPYEMSLYLTNTATTQALACAQYIAQFNAIMAVWKNQFKDLRSMKLVKTSTDDLRLLLPFGMIGQANIIGEEGSFFTVGAAGVDRPLVFGQIGKRKHVFLVRYPFRDDYYGTLPVG